jgi:hypothetical protein
VSFSFFTAQPTTDSASGEVLVPTDVSRSLWSADQMHGVAISGAMARGIERAVTRDDLRPARYPLDMVRPARMQPFTVETRVVRESKRILLIDAVLCQDGEDVARAGCVWLKATEDPEGEVWRPEDLPSPPPADVTGVLDGPTIPWFRSDAGWSQNFTEHQNAGRKQTWQHGVPVMADEEGSPFQAIAAIADATTMVCNWGTRGVEYINTDITLSLARLPRTQEVGLQATSWTGADGLATGVATVHDRDGIIGHSMVTALSNSRRTVDFDQHTYEEDGTRTSRV